jgi:branched chain amino acid efflux pump
VPEISYILSVVLVASAVTWALRAVPFALLAPLRHSSLLPYLAERMPVGVMAILTVYTLRHVDLVDVGSVVPASVGMVVTAALHLWRGNMILSLGGGTALYVVMASTVFR